MFGMNPHGLFITGPNFLSYFPIIFPWSSHVSPMICTWIFSVKSPMFNLLAGIAKARCCCRHGQKTQRRWPTQRCNFEAEPFWKWEKRWEKWWRTDGKNGIHPSFCFGHWWQKGLKKTSFTQFYRWPLQWEKNGTWLEHIWTISTIMTIYGCYKLPSSHDHNLILSQRVLGGI